MPELVTLCLQELHVEMMQHLSTNHLHTKATVLSFQMVFLIMMLKMMLWSPTQTLDVKVEFQKKELSLMNNVILDGPT